MARPKEFVEFLQGDVDRDWTAYARCKDLDKTTADNYFFHPATGRDPYTETRRAYCGGCPVRWECLAYGQAVAPNGAWGGFSEEERREMRHGQKATRTEDSEQRESETV